MQELVSFEDFKKLDLRIGTIKQAEKVEGSRQLIKLIVDLGEESRQLIAGIDQIIDDPKDLIGKQVPIVANLKPKTIMGLESQGMILAVDVDGKPVLIYPEKQVPSGASVR